MKRFIILLFISFVFMIGGYAQNSSSVEAEPVKNNINILMDGGCTYYTYDSLPYNPHSMRNTVLAINTNSTAIIKIAGKSENTYLEVVSKNDFTNDTDTSTYKGHGYILKLNTHKVYKTDLFYYFYEGTMTVTHNNASKTIKIHGIAWVPKKE